MKKFDTLYEDSNTYPKRLDDCLENLCQQVGLVLGSKDFPNNSYMIKGNPFTNGETRKTALSNLVQLTGGFAEIDMEDGKLYVRNFDISGEPVETIDGNNYDEFKPNNVFGPVNSVRILMNNGVDGEETIKEAEGVTDENRCQITIADNYYLTSAEERELVINEIFNALNGLIYLPIELSYYGYPWLKLGQKIKVKDKNDNEFITYVMEHTLKYNGAYSGTIKATALTKTQQAYNEVISLKQWRRNTELAVDKINGKITSVIEEQSATSEKLTQVEQDVNGVTTRVSSTENQIIDITTTEGTATGKNIHTEDSSEEPLVDIVVKGETKQEGEPTPDEPIEIKNVEGKNKFDYNVLFNKDTGKIDTDNLIYQNSYWYYYNLKLKENTNYMISTNAPSDSSNCTFIVVNSETSFTTNNGGVFSKRVVSTSDDGILKVGIRVGAYGDVPVTSKSDFDQGIYYIQIEEGVAATEYVPYNSLVINVVGKNIISFPYYDKTITKAGVTFTQNDDGSVTANGTATANSNYNFLTNENIVLKKGKYTLSGVTDGSSTTYYLQLYVNNKAQATLSSGSHHYSFQEDDILNRVVLFFKEGAVFDNLIIKPQLEYGTEATDYELYKSQTETFPLAEGQKLYEGSYLADDGIHQKFRELSLAIADMNNTEKYPGWTNLTQLKEDYPSQNTRLNQICDNAYCNITENKGSIIVNTTGSGILCLSTNVFGLTQTEWKEQYPDLVFNLQYELPEEKIIPYTEEQQEAWDKIKELYTYKNITNITSTADLDIVYVRDNGLSDMYETKQNANKKYTKTSTEIQQLDDSIKRTIEQIGDRSEKTTTITEDLDGIKQEVSSIQDITNEISGTKTITLENCQEGSLLELHIYGNNSVFEILYPSDTLYPSDDLYPMGDSRILVNDTLYELGVTEVLRQNGTIKDEYVLEKGQSKIIRRINTDGSIKDEEIVEDLGELNIPLNEGSNTIQIKNYYAEIEAKYAVKNDYTDVFATRVEMNSSIAQTAKEISTEVNKKVDEEELGTKITQNYESVQIAWNSISEFIQFLNAMLQILGENKKLLMSLDKTGMHFYNSSGQEIGNIGIYNSEVSFYINGDISGSSMSWGINKTINGEKKYFPVFLYEGYNTESGTEFGGKFLLEAPLIMQENTLFLGQDTNSSYIKSLDSNERKKVTIGNTDDFYIYNSSGDLIFVLNSSYLKLYEQLEMGINLSGAYTFDFKDNIITGVDRATINEITSNSATIDDIPNSDNVRRFNNTGTDYLIAVLKSSAGGGSIYCQNASSDKKFKDNIKDTEINALDIVKQIQHRQFNWKESKKHEEIGYIAQELEQISPYLVNKIQEDSEETYLLNEKALIATATKAIQEQQEQIEQLKAEIKELKGENTNG